MWRVESYHFIVDTICICNSFCYDHFKYTNRICRMNIIWFIFSWKSSAWYWYWGFRSSSQGQALLLLHCHCRLIWNKRTKSFYSLYFKRWSHISTYGPTSKFVSDRRSLTYLRGILFSRQNQVLPENKSAVHTSTQTTKYKICIQTILYWDRFDVSL